MPTNRKDLIRNLKQAAKNNTLMTPKHNPNNLGTAMKGFRTVLSFDLASNLNSFIDSEDFRVYSYNNSKKPLSPTYIEIIPNSSSGFLIPSSGVTSYSPFATSALDSIIVVSGKTQGWHMFGESSLNIQNMLNNGDLTDKIELT